MLYLHIVPTQETFRHKVTVSVEKGNITFRFSSKNLNTPTDYFTPKQKQNARQTKKTKRLYLPTSAPVLGLSKYNKEKVVKKRAKQLQSLAKQLQSLASLIDWAGNNGT